jgi:hypothetical protein
MIVVQALAVVALGVGVGCLLAPVWERIASRWDR